MSLQELEAFELDLHREFTTEIDNELPVHLKEMRLRHGAELLHAVASLLLVPYGAVSGTKDVIVSGLRLAGKDAIAESIEKRIRELLDAWRRVIDRREPEDRAILLGYVGKLKHRYADKLSRSE